MTEVESEAEALATELLDFLEQFGESGAEELSGELFADRQIGVTAMERERYFGQIFDVLRFVSQRLEF